MIRLADHADERRELGQRGRDFAEAKFHIRIVADAYENIYSDMLGE
jgi:glycosyltransferase involved in cell wall biosynthesis